MSAKKVSENGLLLALAIILSYVESLIPVHFMVPGMKLGLANLCILVCLYRYGFKEACVINFLRVLLIGLMFTNMFSFFYSLSGAIFSLLVMGLMKHFDVFNIITISVAGGIFHNVGQLFVCVTFFQNENIMFYGPVLFVSGIVTGTLIGIISAEVLRRVKRQEYK